MENILQENLKLVEENPKVTEMDKFFRTDNGFIEVYYNPCAVSGGQLVYHEISDKMIREAHEKTKTPGDFYEYLDCCCRQYFIDINTPEFKSNFESLKNRKADLENCNRRTMHGLKKAAGVVPKRIHIGSER